MCLPAHSSDPPVLDYLINPLQSILPIRGRLLMLTAYFAPATLFVALCIRQIRFVNKYAVNLMCWDLWDFYSPLFHRQGWWACFDRQHGPHRQGVGMLLTRIIAQSTHWNTRADAFGVLATVIAATLLAFALAWLVGVRNPLALLAVPLLCLNIRQYESFIAAPNISHAAMPLFLFMAFGLSYFVRPVGIRLLLQTGLTFCLIFTGFGLFVGCIAPLLFLCEAIIAARKQQWRHMWFAFAALGSVGLSWLLFFHGYVWSPAVPNFHFPYEHPVEYLYFIVFMLDNFFGLSGLGFASVAVGTAVAGTLLFLIFWHGRRLLRIGPQGSPRGTVIFSLAAFCILYCINTAVGRVFLGWQSGSFASRYVILMTTGPMAIYLHFATIKPRWFSLGFTLLATAIIARGVLFLPPLDQGDVNYYHDSRVVWRQIYLATGNEKTADQESGLLTYWGFGNIRNRLEYLRRLHLNFFYKAEHPAPAVDVH